MEGRIGDPFKNTVVFPPHLYVCDCLFISLVLAVHQCALHHSHSYCAVLRSPIQLCQILRRFAFLYSSSQPNTFGSPNPSPFGVWAVFSASPQTTEQQPPLRRKEVFLAVPPLSASSSGGITAGSVALSSALHAPNPSVCCPFLSVEVLITYLSVLVSLFACVASAEGYRHHCHRAHMTCLCYESRRWPTGASSMRRRWRRKPLTSKICPISCCTPYTEAFEEASSCSNGGWRSGN